VSYKQGV